MKALTIWQPWAQLVAVGAKRIETRGWPAPAGVVGQRIAIHSAVSKRALGLVDVAPFSDHLVQPLPFGAVVATVVLARCTPITGEFAAELCGAEPLEFRFGDYTAGRWAWELEDLEALAVPVPWKGLQKLWNLPDEAIA